MDWVEFDGKARRIGKAWRLHPFLDPNVEIDLESDDVYVERGKTFIRVGSRAVRIEIPDGSLINKAPSRISPPKCGGKSRCVGGVEFCCTNDVAGSCDGHWNLCGTGGKGGPGGQSRSFKVQIGRTTPIYSTPGTVKV